MPSHRDPTEMRGDYTQYLFGKRLDSDRNKGSSAFRKPLNSKTGGRLKDNKVAEPHVTSEYTTAVPTTIGKDTPQISFGGKNAKAAKLDRAQYITRNAGTQGKIGEYTTELKSSFDTTKGVSFGPKKHVPKLDRGEYIAPKLTQGKESEYTTAVPSTTGKESYSHAASFGPKKSPGRLDRGEFIAKGSKGGLGEYTTPVYSSFAKAASPGRTNAQSQQRKRAPAPSSSEGNSRLNLAKEHRFSTNTEFTTSMYSSFNVAPKQTEAQRRRQMQERKRTDTWLGVPKQETSPGPGFYFVP